MKFLKNKKQQYMQNLSAGLSFKVKALLFANLLIVLDLLSKSWADDRLQTDSIRIIDNFFNLALAYNKGVSFSMFSSLESGRFVLSGFAITVGLLFAFFAFGTNKRADALGYMMIFAGAFGNGIDRLVNGHVIDFLDFYYKNWHYPTFNLADCFIFIGVAIIILADCFKPNHKDSN
ncbi:MAG: signal peptidase II [Proteobacteria bacterium]|nr:signal peptidase II [Pseudomonadota bacterium]